MLLSSSKLDSTLRDICAEKWRVFEEAFPHAALVYEYFQEWSNDHCPLKSIFPPTHLPIYIVYQQHLRGLFLNNRLQNTLDEAAATAATLRSRS